MEVTKSEQSAALAVLIAQSAIKVTRIDAGQSALGLTNAAWREVTRKPKAEREYIHRGTYVLDRIGREHCRNGQGEWLY